MLRNKYLLSPTTYQNKKQQGLSALLSSSSGYKNQACLEEYKKDVLEENRKAAAARTKAFLKSSTADAILMMSVKDEWMLLGTKMSHSTNY